MSKDRSALGGNTAGAGAYQPGGLPSAGNRLPTSRRERKPALAALAVLLILAGALATMVLVNRSGNRVSVVEITRTVAAGAKITADDIAEARVAADNSINYVPYDQVNDVIGRTAPNTLVGGSLLVTQMLGSGQQQMLKAGEAMIGFLFKTGQYPSKQLQAGDVVELWSTNGGGNTGGGNTGGGSTGGGSGSGSTGGTGNTATLQSTLITKQARILDWSNSGDSLNLTLAVPENLVGQLEALTGNVAVAKLPNPNAPAQ